MSVNARPTGTDPANSSYLMLVPIEVERGSTSGARSVTITVSVTPVVSAKESCVRWFRATTTSFCTTLLNPPGASIRTV